MTADNPSTFWNAYKSHIPSQLCLKWTKNLHKTLPTALKIHCLCIMQVHVLVQFRWTAVWPPDQLSSCLSRFPTVYSTNILRWHKFHSAGSGLLLMLFQKFGSVFDWFRFHVGIRLQFNECIAALMCIKVYIQYEWYCFTVLKKLPSWVVVFFPFHLNGVETMGRVILSYKMC